ncbi:hypothetical protein DL96DRAFT_1452938, partial [Flagelloscypha sp. PMI_526]
PTGRKTYNYEMRYPVDAPGRESDYEARVWKIYLDAAEEYDRDMGRGFRSTLDSVLLFASILSVVITAFIVEIARTLPTDQAVITNHLLTDIATLLRANGNATVLTAIPPSNYSPDTITFKTADICIGSLFFASLSCSLVTALLSVLAKQWVLARTAVVPGRTKKNSLIQPHSFCGLETWKVHDIIGALPFILHASLTFFFAGLFVFARNL